MEPECRTCGGAGYLVLEQVMPGPPATRDCPDCPRGRESSACVRAVVSGAEGDLVPEWPWAMLRGVRREQNVPRYLEFLESVRPGSKGVLLIGKSHTGKTTLARWMAQRLGDMGHPIAGVIWPQWMEEIHRKHRENPGSTSHIKALASVDVILLDDVLAGGAQPKQEEAALQALLDRRWGRPVVTIMTTNLEAQQLAKRPERILNRIRKQFDILPVEGRW